MDIAQVDKKKVLNPNDQMYFNAVNQTEQNLKMQVNLLDGLQPEKENKRSQWSRKPS